jgi:hypothetical protein
VRKHEHDHNVLDALSDAITGNPWTPPPTCRPEWLRPVKPSLAVQSRRRVAAIRNLEEARTEGLVRDAQ